MCVHISRVLGELPYHKLWPEAKRGEESHLVRSTLCICGCALKGTHTLRLCWESCYEVQHGHSRQIGTCDQKSELALLVFQRTLHVCEALPGSLWYWKLPDELA